jgi:hypothetical protein
LNGIGTISKSVAEMAQKWGQEMGSQEMGSATIFESRRNGRNGG